MTIYAIGDVQGCFTALEKLLAHIQFDTHKDKLWFTGDLVNRGPQSLAVLRFVKALGAAQVTILGNHDLSLLALAYGVRSAHHDDTLDEILNASDRDELITWLRHRPLLHKEKGYVLVHAGLAPAWELDEACALAQEVEIALRSPHPDIFLQNMFGNQPDRWDTQLSGMARLRCITNYLTRMRFCHEDGRLDLDYKGGMADKPSDLIPWFNVKHRKNAKEKIIFGHWAALNGKTDIPHVYALDTGCVWGNCLTAMRLDDAKRFTVKCK